LREAQRADESQQGEIVWLHIYDVSAGTIQWVNSIARTVGTGAFHAGLEIFGLEYSFGFAGEGKTGVYHCVPKCNQQHRYRESMVMGKTSLSPADVRELVEQLRAEWRGKDYDLLARNCCHFSDAFCKSLGVGPIPAWLLHLAESGKQLIEGGEQAVSKVDSFLMREIEFNEDSLQSMAKNLFFKAVEELAPVGVYAEKLFDKAMQPLWVEEVETKVQSNSDQSNSDHDLILRI